MRLVYTLMGVFVLGMSCRASVPLSIDNHNVKDIITRDVCIIGGGASGTYAAMRLRDMNQSVVIVERTNRLGGHTETFTDPGTNATIDIGVIVWHNTTIVQNFFSRFNIPLTKTNFSSEGLETKFVDFLTGAIVPGILPSDPTAALEAYAAQLAKYPYLEAGFELPDPVPEDLLLPFGDFVDKYNISAVVPITFQFTQGIGNLLKTPTLYVMKLFSTTVIESIQRGFVTTARHDNSEIYEKAQGALLTANSLLLGSHVVSTNRGGSDGYTTIITSTPFGPKVIRAKKILLTVPPTLHNLDPFDLDNTERSLFKQFSTTAYYTGLLRHSGIPDNISIQNTGVNTTNNLPRLPAIYAIAPTGVSGLHSVFYGSPTPLSNNQVRHDIFADVNRLRIAGTLPTTTPEFAVFSGHNPFEFTVPASAIKAGFYRSLNARQGKRKMFYTGAAFHTHDSSLLWQFTEALLPHIVA